MRNPGVKGAETQKEKDDQMQEEVGDPSKTARGVAGSVTTDSAAAQIAAMRKGLALNRFKADKVDEDDQTVPAEPMSQTQLNKLCNASRLKRYTQKKKNRCGRRAALPQSIQIMTSLLRSVV